MKCRIAASSETGNEIRGGSAPAAAVLDLRQHRLRAAHFVFPGCFDVQLLHHAVLDQHRVALRAHAHVARGEVEREAELLRPFAAAVAEHADLAARLLVAAPCGHHEGVVGRHAPDLIHAFRLELAVVLHVARNVKNHGQLKAKGVDEIWCVATNDAFVMAAWGRDQKAGGKVRMLGDGSGEWTKKLGLSLDLTARNMGVRSQRYSMLVENGVVKKLNIEAPGKYEVSGAETMLAQI